MQPQRQGGQILGPYLKPMTHLVHTEYLLAGHSHRDVRQILRDSMFAATVTGSPVENACRLIKAYEPTGRGYYAAVMALIGRDADGTATADAPILIRTGDVSLEGDLQVTAGATLVRDSDPVYEVDGIIHYCVANMPGAVARTSAFALNNATLPFALRIARLGADEAMRQDPHLAAGLNVSGGKIRHQAVAEALDLDYEPVAA